ncbi:MAG: alcohol dehydrogenase catalytic domain-containing protein [Gemmatimonadetes bacterium]|nr:alcohol dehydrogenase catalytic domain-containing protein [Gemmatimonadota bacterium]
MLALVKTKKGKDAMELRDVPEPVIADDEVLIEVKAAGICGTDMHVKHDTFPYWPPVTMGHEFAGVIADRGGAVTGWEIGDRVIGEPHTLHCGQCYLCRRGYIQNCADKRSPGWGIDGAFTKYLKYPTKLLHRIPDGMTFSQAALVEPAANTVTDIIERKAIEAGDFIVLLGPGPIGLMAAQAARTAGAREILIVGAPADQGLRLDTARQLGFDNVIDFSKTNPLEKCLEMTAGIGADLVIECSGAPPAIAQTFELVRKWGRICAIGYRQEAGAARLGRGHDQKRHPLFQHVHHVCELGKDDLDGGAEENRRRSSDNPRTPSERMGTGLRRARKHGGPEGGADPLSWTEKQSSVI